MENEPSPCWVFLSQAQASQMFLDFMLRFNKSYQTQEGKSLIQDSWIRGGQRFFLGGGGGLLGAQLCFRFPSWQARDFTQV